MKPKKGMKRRDFLRNVTRGAAAFSALPILGQKGILNPKQDVKISPKENPGKRRNVIFILSDDHRYDFMGFMGHPPFLKTPNMDRMARE
ncbi:MAG TPA: acetylglucosamine-6-sulfatase, partial [Bacteroidetes bacterium]|nr:acetylglucosamine-6-sulfatase [Bacteroidota bacterium]